MRSTFKEHVGAYAEDLRLDTERRLISKGSVRVRFEYIKWNEYQKADETKKKPDLKRLEHLKRIFRTEGCRPLPAKHHIPAIVEPDLLDTAIEVSRRKNELKTDTLPSNYAIIHTQDGYPELEFPGGIQCLHGLHRIEAGKEWLSLSQIWWIVDLYLSNISWELKNFLIEEYANEEKPCQGEIYRKIRDYQDLPKIPGSRLSPTTCISLEMRWWAQLNESREGKLRSLFKSTLAAGFDALTKFPGLFDAGMMITTLNTIMATKSYKDRFLKGIKDRSRRVDKATVKEMKRRAPGVSTLDADFLRDQVLSGKKIFSDFSPRERKVIWKNILAFKSIIPSLFTFFQDVHLLEACVDSLKWLVTVSCEEVTVSAAFDNRYKSKREIQRVQTTESAFRPVTGSPEDCMRLGYLVLVAFAMRNHQNLPKAPVKKNLKTKPRVKADAEVLQRFASLAADEGFKSPEIEALKGEVGPLVSPDTQESAPLVITTGPGQDIKQRCGLPHSDTFEQDRNHLFLHHLSKDMVETDEGITSFFVLKSWFAAFFNPPPWTNQATSRDSSSTSLLLAHSTRIGEEDVNMGDAQPGTLNQRDLGQETEQITQELGSQGLDMEEQIQEIIESAQQKMNRTATVATQILGEEEDTLFGRLLVRDVSILLMGICLVSRLPTPQRAVLEADDTVVIRFVEREGDESDMLSPVEEHVGEVQELKVDHGDPASLVKQIVLEFFLKGKRTCDRYKKYVPADHCYNVATREENKNTLFLIPDVHYTREAGMGIHETPEGAMEDPRDHESTQEIIQEPWGERQVTECLEGHRTPDSDGESLEALLEQAQENATNARILDKNTIIIRLWTSVQDTLNILGLDDCYKAAVEDEDHALYSMVPSPRTEEERVAERTMLWKSPFLLPPEALHWRKESSRGRRRAPPQAQEGLHGLESSSFTPPPGLRPLPPEQKSVKDPPKFHWSIPSPPPQPEQKLVEHTVPPRQELARAPSWFHRNVSSPPHVSEHRLVEHTTEDYRDLPLSEHELFLIESWSRGHVLTFPPPSELELAEHTTEDHSGNPAFPPLTKHQLPLVEATSEVHKDKIVRSERKFGKAFQNESTEIRRRPKKASSHPETADGDMEVDDRVKVWSKAWVRDIKPASGARRTPNNHNNN
ncbi:uncharacterized protein LY89DRAFT_723432 [Mollisia scopiformis]|uniref:Uncharacterized protein n=1 Tax=Mollisia scopiformis TaxID=149040 RepID=A0A194WTA4_MOLSC|nr:uncharacterized protein LY89DRAFT_723432 [Mollisia scopiformis]KUJ10914.1 hypothetical protein LY89DRAFT_723432 [Mollisia scopiformis]